MHKIIVAATAFWLIWTMGAWAQDWQATAEAADQRAWSAQATGQAARQQATAEMIRATETAQVQATAQAGRATATAASAQATGQAGVLQTTQAAQATEAIRSDVAWSRQATSEALTYQAQATQAAYLVERERLATERARAWQPVIVYGGWVALIFAVVVAVRSSHVLIDRVFVARRRERSNHSPLAGDIIEADFDAMPSDGAVTRMQILALPEPGRTNLWVDGAGRFWRGER
jgi:hypothetical protein